MALLDWITCDLESTAEFDSTQTSSNGSISFTTSDLFAGYAALRLIGGGVSPTTQAVMNFASARTALTVRFFVDVSARFGIGGGGAHDIFSINIDIGGSAVLVRHDSDAADCSFFLVDGSGTNFGSVLSFAEFGAAAQRWFCVEVSLDDTGGLNKYRLRVWKLDLDGSGTLKETEGTSANVAQDWVSAGPYYQASLPVRYQHIILDGNYGADLGPHLMLQWAPPVADITTEWATNPGGQPNHYGLLDERVRNDADSINTTTNNAWERYEVQDPSLPNGKNVKAISLGCVHQGGGALHDEQIHGYILDPANATVATAFVRPSVTVRNTSRALVRHIADIPKATAQGYRMGFRHQTVGGGGDINNIYQAWFVYVMDTSVSSVDTATGDEDVSEHGSIGIDSAQGAEDAFPDRIPVPDSALGFETPEINFYKEGEDAAGAEESISVERVDNDSASGEEVPEYRLARAGDDAAGGEDTAAVHRVAFPDVAVGEGEQAEVNREGVDQASGESSLNSLSRIVSDSAEGEEVPETRLSRDGDDASGGEEAAALARSEMDSSVGVDEAALHERTAEDDAVGSGDYELTQQALDTATGAEIRGESERIVEDSALGHEYQMVLDARDYLFTRQATTRLLAGASSVTASSDHVGSASSTLVVGALPRFRKKSTDRSLEGEGRVLSGESSGTVKKGSKAKIQHARVGMKLLKDSADAQEV